MTDVAKLAGVSQTTVSFVLNNVAGANISEETRASVLDAARQLGYRSTPSLVTLQSTHSHVIGFVTDEIGTSPFAGDTLKGAQEVAWAAGKMLVLVNTGGRRDVEEEAIRTLAERQVDGIIYAAMFTRRVEPADILHDIPTVLMNCYAADHSLPSVTPNEEVGGRTATLELIQAGRRRIGLINGERWMDAAQDRYRGYCQALQASQIPLDAALVRYGNWRPDSGYDNTMQLMRLPDPPDALFCGNDLVAVGAYEALKELGKRIPQDVSVIGYDNQEQLTEYMRPSLSTMALPHYEMGQWAAQELLARITAGGQSPATQQKLACPLIRRDSIEYR